MSKRNNNIASRQMELRTRVNLTLTLAQREISSRYKGSLLGVVWAIISPAIMLVIYTFVFSVIFQAKWSSASTSKVEFALILFLGLIIFNFFAEVVTRAPTAITSNANYVKKVIFPVEILSIVQVVAALFQASLSAGVWLIAYVIAVGIPPINILLLPLVILNLTLMLTGMSWFLSSLGVLIKDTSYLVAITVSLLLFLSPIFYPVTAVPESFRGFIYLNPLTTFIELARQCAFTPENDFFLPFLVSFIIAVCFLIFGYAWFQLTRKEFADVL